MPWPPHQPTPLPDDTLDITLADLEGLEAQPAASVAAASLLYLVNLATIDVPVLSFAPPQHLSGSHPRLMPMLPEGKDEWRRLSVVLV